MDTKAKYKKQAALRAIEYIEDGMVVGLGTGSTAAPFIEALGEKVRDGMEIQGVPTSEGAARLARAAGIDLIIPDETTQIHIDVDGADEIDPDGNLIKGGGGAHQREKIIAAAADRLVIIGDSSKRVGTLGRFPLPIEIDPFCYSLTVRKVRSALAGLGYEDPNLSLRTNEEKGDVMISDGGHLILDARLERITDPAILDNVLANLPGVISTGLFIGLTQTSIIAGDDGVDVKQYK